jgi:hypothetical protein
MPSRRIVRDINEDARDVARRKMKTKAFLKSRDERKRVEMRFAHLKTHHGFERMRLRGLAGARDEFHLAAIVQNLKTMALRLLGPPHPKCVHPSRNWAGASVALPRRRPGSTPIPAQTTSRRGKPTTFGPFRQHRKDSDIGQRLTLQ